MKPAPDIGNERARCAALRELAILDTPPDERFDRITRMAKTLFGVEIALVSLVDAERQWFKSRQGLEATQTDRSISFCGHAIERNAVFVVEDTLEDERFRDNPLVVGAPYIRFYAGCPIHGPGGHLIGTLCIIDPAPRRFGGADRSILTDLGQLVDLELAEERRRVSAGSYAPESLRARLAGFWNPIAERLAERKLAAISALLAALLLGLAALSWDRQQLAGAQSQARQDALQTLGLMRGELETALNARLHLVHGLSGLVHADRKIEERAFQAFAQQLGSGVSQIRSLQLAPDGVVKHVWPLESNQEAIGHDLMADEARRDAALRAIDSRQIWLAGPVNLIQGGTALIGRLPIFVPPAEENGLERWWGFATILIDVNELYDEAGLGREVVNYRFALRGRDALGQAGEIFFGEDGIFDHAPVSATIKLPAGAWELAIAPRDGWPEQWDGQSSFRLGTLLIMLVVGSLVFFLLRLPMNMRRAIRLATAELSSTQLRFRDAIEALPAGFTIFDENDRLAVCNEYIREIYPNSRPRLEIGRDYEDILRFGLLHGEILDVDPTNDAAVAAAVELSVARHRNPKDAFDVQLSSGRWVRVVEQRTRDGGSVSFHIDVTQQKQTELSLREARSRAEDANQAKSTFLATVSHEVRTPLNGVLGLLSVLVADPSMNVKQKEYLETAHSSAKHLLSLLNEILDISKMEAGKLELEDGEFCLLDIFNESLDLLGAQAQQKGVALIAHLDEELEQQVCGDAARLRQVLLNLLSNGIKFTDEGEVELHARRVHGPSDRLNVEIEVRDSGLGFSAAEAATLFKPFTQLDSTAERRHQGTGLGLAICKSIIDEMGGQISATGSPGRGAVFQIHLSLARTEQRTAEAVPRDEHVPTPRELGWPDVRLLLAEDSPTNQLVLQAMLEGTGYLVDTVSNGREAVDSALQFPYDLILMDVYMPEMDGLQATRLIRERIPVEKTPIIALTANAMEGDRERFVEAGMDDYVAKPINRAALLQALHLWLETRNRKVSPA